MADDLLKELLTSPLDNPKQGRRRARSDVTASGVGQEGTESAPMMAWPWVVGAAVLGATIVIVAYLVADDGPVAAAPTTTTTSAPAPAANDGSPSGLPAEYTAVGDRLGMRVERILVRSDGVFVTVTTVIENSLDPDQSTGYQGGIWTLVMADGRRVTSTNESFDALAPGTVSIHFPPAGIVAEDIQALEVNGLANRLTNVVSAESQESFILEPGGTPLDLALDPTTFSIDANVELVIDSVSISASGAAIAWSLSGEATAAVFPVLTIAWSDGTTTVMTTRMQTSGFNFFHPSIATPVMRDGGEAVFDPPTSDDLPADTPLGVTLELQVTWATYSPIVASLPVAGAQIAVVTG